MKIIAQITRKRKVIITGSVDRLIMIMMVLTNSPEYKGLPKKAKEQFKDKYNVLKYSQDFDLLDINNPYEMKIVEIRIMSRV